MTNKIISTLCALFAILLAGCGSAPIPPELQYHAPLAATNVATITGSEVPSLLTHNQTAYVYTVDGKVVMAGKKGWNVPLVLEAGPRIVGVLMLRGDFLSRSYLELEAIAGAHYVLRFETDVGLVGENTYCDFWIIDAATGKPVTPKQRGGIEGGGR